MERYYLGNLMSSPTLTPVQTNQLPTVLPAPAQIPIPSSAPAATASEIIASSALFLPAMRHAEVFEQEIEAELAATEKAKAVTVKANTEMSSANTEGMGKELIAPLCLADNAAKEDTTIPSGEYSPLFIGVIVAVILLTGLMYRYTRK